MMIVDQIPGFIAGAAVSAVVSFFVWRNNPALMNKIYSQAKAEFDEKEKELRAKIEKLELKERIVEILKELKEKV